MTTEAQGFTDRILVAGAFSSVPEIKAVAERVQRPRWSVMIPTYNCARFLGQTLESVLAQDPGTDQMQIEVVDDCSTSDDPMAVVEKIGRGRVSFFRQPVNVGPTPNFNTCLQRSVGHQVHLLHGDDYVLDGFYRLVGEVSELRPELAFFHVRSLIVNEADELDTVSPRTQELERGGSDASSLYYENPLRTPAVVVRRQFYEQWGGFDEQLVHVADWEMWVRAVTLGGGIAVNSLLAAYRSFPLNHTSQLARTGENLRDYLRLADKLAARDMPGYSLETFRARVAQAALYQADDFQLAGDVRAAEMNMTVWNDLASTRMRIRRSAQLLRQYSSRWTK